MPRLSYTSTRCVTIAFALAMFSLALRLVWVASQTETGWETIVVSWHEATLGRVGLARNQIEFDAAESHVQFWRERLVPVIERSSQRADSATAAARVVEQHVWGLRGGLVDLPGFTCSDNTQLFAPGFWEKLGEDYAQASAPTILEFASIATTLEPDRPEHWRRQALLLIRGYPLQPRIAEWREVLAEAECHDPNNALYDYIATICLWNASSRSDVDFSARWIVVEDDRLFDKGWQSFEQGLARDYFRIEVVDAEAIYRVLSQSPLTHLEASRIAMHRSLQDHTRDLLDRLVRHIEWQAESKRREGDFRGALELLQSANGAIDQFEPQTGVGSRRMVDACRAELLDSLLDPSADNLDLLSEEQWDEYATQQHDSLLRLEVRSEARRRVSQNAESESPFKSPFDAAFPVLLMEYTQSLVAGMLICGLLAIAAARFIPHKKADVVRFGVWRHVLVWCVSFGLTLVVLGLSPTEMIEHENRRIAIVVAVWILGGGFSIWLARVLIRRYRRVDDARGRLALTAVLVTWAATWAILLALTRPIIPWDRGDITWWLACLPVTVLVMGIILPVLVLGMLFDLIRRRYRMKKRLPREYVMAGLLLLLTTAIVFVILWNLPVFDWEVDGLPALAPRWPEGAWILEEKQSPPQAWRQLLWVTRDSWQWGVAQWTTYYGPLVTPLLGLLLTGSWYLAIARKRRKTAGEADLGKRSTGFWAGLLRCLGASAVVLSTVALLVYLISAPCVVEQLESEHNKNLAMLRPNGSYWSKVAEIERDLLANPKAMQRIEEGLTR